MHCFTRRGFTRRTFAATLVLALTGAPAAASAQIAPDRPDLGPPARTLRELTDRYLAWRGPAFGQLQGLHARAYFEGTAGRRSGAIWLDRSGRRRIEMDGPGGKQIEAAGPDGAWRLEAGGAPADDPGGAEAARRYAALEFGEAFTGRGGAQASLAGTAEAQDHTWSVVRVSFGDADTYDALIEPVIGVLCCYRITEKGVTREILFGDWRLVDGVRVPFGQLTRQGADASEMRLAAVEVNPPLSDALFARPAS
jgi:hypothetical protein